MRASPVVDKLLLRNGFRFVQGHYLSEPVQGCVRGIIPSKLKDGFGICISLFMAVGSRMAINPREVSEVMPSGEFGSIDLRDQSTFWRANDDPNGLYDVLLKRFADLENAGTMLGVMSYLQGGVLEVPVPISMRKLLQEPWLVRGRKISINGILQHAAYAILSMDYGLASELLRSDLLEREVEFKQDLREFARCRGGRLE